MMIINDVDDVVDDDDGDCDDDDDDYVDVKVNKQQNEDD